MKIPVHNPGKSPPIAQLVEQLAFNEKVPGSIPGGRILVKLGQIPYYKIMTIATYSKLKREIKKELIKEFITPLLEDIKDSEGEYRLDFVKEIFRAAQEKPHLKYHSKTFSKLIS